MDLEKFAKDSHRAEGENRKLFEKLKRKKPKDLDEQFDALHDDAFSRIDCLQCANCCKTTSPIFYEKDIERASKSLHLKPGQFIEKYLHIDEDKDYVLNSAPCPFLDSENYCLIYADRPGACREYPHTNRKRMYQVLDLAMKNTLVCPAVLDISKALQKIYS
ncbi:MAG TPA: YkgJ family cysteine cluster protein [Bacteroidia bacterium]|jgi:Fe-S-cluster containining protein|nr:YkgJ family cysteine cluster protein [Bacteroidia bacterium]